MDEQEITKIRETVSTYETPELADRIVEAFAEEREVRYSHLQWQTIARALESSRPFSMGLSGKVGLAWDEFSTMFPHVHITNQLTGPNVYSGLVGKKGYLVLQSIGRDATSHALHQEFFGAYEVGERGNSFGAVIKLNPNDEGSNIFIHQDIVNGFLFDHEDRMVYSLDEPDEFFANNPPLFAQTQ